MSADPKIVRTAAALCLGAAAPMPLADSCRGANGGIGLLMRGGAKRSWR